MKKVTIKTHETHAKRLSVIINAQSQFVPFLKKPDFSTILKTELNTLYAIEKLLPDSKLEEKFTSEALAKQLSEITKEQWTVNKEYKYDDEDDLIDNVNYLPKYCSNIFKVDLDALVEGKQVNVETPNINFKDPDMGDVGMDAANAFNMGAMGFGTGSIYENPLLAGKAFAKLREDFAKGKIYQYKTKPRIIPVIKWVLCVLMFLLTAGALLTSVAIFMLNKVKVIVSGESINWNTITNGMFYVILAAFFAYVFSITVINIVKGWNKKNENQYYSFNWPFYLTAIVLGILIYLLDLGFTWTNVPTFDNISALHRTVHTIWKVMVIVGPSLCGLSIIPMVLGAVYAPKPDVERIEQLLHKYIDEIVGTTPGQTGVDVQKPVDVKPSEDKKPTEEQPA